MRHPQSPVYTAVHLLLAIFLSFQLSICQTTSSKRGLAYHDPATHNEYSIFFSDNSSITWYYNWLPHLSPSAPRTSSLDFLPLIHGLTDLSSTIKTVTSLPQNPPHPRLLTFNEPDGSISSGGSDISPQDAAEAYINSIAPLSAQYQLSHPSTTGTGNGLNWLAQFNTSCYDISPTTGCPSDFVATHFYGDFPALASWLGQLHAVYPSQKIWVTEFALPQADANTTLRMMRQSLPYLDGLDYVAGYAWFGLFRTSEANNWTGPGPSLLDASGGLTQLGVEYLGGDERGFQVGQTSVGSDSGMGMGVGGGASAGAGVLARVGRLGLVVVVAVGVCLWNSDVI